MRLLNAPLFPELKVSQNIYASVCSPLSHFATFVMVICQGKLANLARHSEKCFYEHDLQALYQQQSYHYPCFSVPSHSLGTVTS